MCISDAAERLFAGRWIAGPYMEDAMRRSERLNSLGMRTIVNYLGEELHDIAEVRETLGTYHKLIEGIKRRNIRADISVKPTELGMDIGVGTARRNYLDLVRLAKKNGVFVWMDMEAHGTVGEAIKLYEMAVGMGNTGICMQSYLKRTAADVELLARLGATVRLVKGAYSEPESIAYPTREETTENYYRLMGALFKKAKRFTIATHDTEIIEKALKLNKIYKRDVTYAMLNGVRNQYALMLAKKGEKVSIYVPFGKRWVSYSLRRFREINNVKLLARSMLERGP